MGKKNFIYYFGYGANTDAEMVKAIIGRRPEGKKAKLKNFELCVQRWHEMDDEVKRALIICKWNSAFRTYCARLNVGKETQGVLWTITKDEHRHISNWEMHGLWYKPTKVFVESEGKITEAITEIINDGTLKSALEIHGESYPVFLNNKQKMLEAAKAVREKMDNRYYTDLL